MDKNQYATDKQLVIQFQSGEVYALTELVKRWHKQFCNKAYWIVKDKDIAKDIAQESWKIIISKLKFLKDPNSFKSWALRIVYSKALDHLRETQRAQKKMKSYYNENQGIVVNEHLANQNEALKISLLRALKTLPENQQTVIRLFYVEEYPLKEISNIMQISIGTAKSRLFHAREKLKLIIKYKHYEK